MINVNGDQAPPFDDSVARQASTATLIPGPVPSVDARDPDAESASGGIEMQALVAAFRRRWFLALSVGLLLGTCSAIPAWCLIPAPYTAESELLISSVPDVLIFKTAEARARFETYKQTLMKLVKKRELLEAALEAAFQAEGFNDELLPQDEAAVDWLEENLDVESSAEEFVTLSLSGDHPESLSALVNAVTETYVAEVAGAKHKERYQRLQKLREAKIDADEKLEAARRNVAELTQTLGAANSRQADNKNQHLYELQLQLRKEWAEVYFELLRTELQLKNVQAKGERSEATELPESIIDAQVDLEPDVQRERERLVQVEQRLADIARRIMPGHQALTRVEEQVEIARRRLANARESSRRTIEARMQEQALARIEASESELKDSISYLTAERERFEKELEELKTEEAQTGTHAFDLQAYERDLEVKHTLVEELAREISRMEIELASADFTWERHGKGTQEGDKEAEFAGIQVFRKAKTPDKRNIKKRIAGTGAAGFGALGLWISAVLWLEVRSRRVNSLSDLSGGDLRIRIVGTLPYLSVPARSPGRRGRVRARLGETLLTESIDSVRTTLLREARRDGLRSVIVTSAMGGEGKTTLSCHLATSLTRAGRRVILLDCDLRRPSLHRLFATQPTPGLCELLQATVELEDCVVPTRIDGLSVLPAGELAPDVLKRLAQDELQPLLSRLKNQFDFVIVDSSPVLPVTDGLLVAQQVDVALFSIRRDVSQVTKVAAARERMAQLGVHILGAVVTGVNDRHPYAYGDVYHSCETAARAERVD